MTAYVCNRPGSWWWWWWWWWWYYQWFISNTFFCLPPQSLTNGSGFYLSDAREMLTEGRRLVLKHKESGEFLDDFSSKNKGWSWNTDCLDEELVFRVPHSLIGRMLYWYFKKVQGLSPQLVLAFGTRNMQVHSPGVCNAMLSLVRKSNLKYSDAQSSFKWSLTFTTALKKFFLCKVELKRQGLKLHNYK